MEFRKYCLVCELVSMFLSEIIHSLKFQTFCFGRLTPTKKFGKNAYCLSIKPIPLTCCDVLFVISIFITSGFDLMYTFNSMKYEVNDYHFHVVTIMSCTDLVWRYNAHVFSAEVSMYDVIHMKIMQSRRHLRQEGDYVSNSTSLAKNVLL